MFEIKKSEKKENMYDIYFKGKMLDQAYYDKNNEVIFMDGYPDFDTDEMTDMKLIDFPDNFSLNVSSKKMYAKVLHFIRLRRKGETISLEMSGYLDIHNNDLSWLLWNPEIFADIPNRLAEKKGFFSSERLYDDEPPLLNFQFTYPAKGTAGTVLKKSVEQCKQIMLETDLILLSKAQKKLMR
ncbi:MAG: hypothetical protein ABIT08_12835 [Bacteroidia bacterium]